MEPGQLLRLARRRRRLTQADLAARAGTSQPVISAYEHARRDPTTGTLRRLLAAAGARLELRLAASPPDIPPPANPREHGERLMDLLGLADAVPHRAHGPLDFPRIDSS